MADERKDSPQKESAATAPLGTSHAGPTIDLDASQVIDKTEAENASPDISADTSAPAHAPRGTGLLLAALCGGTAALAVVGALWFGFDGFRTAPPPVTATQFSGMATTIDALTTRLAKAEAAAARPAPSVDAALSRRTEATESSLATLRDDLAAMKSQLAATDASLKDLKTTAPANAAMPDLTPLDQRLAALERSMQGLQAETSKRQSPSTEDVNARRLGVASALDMAVSRGEPFASQLSAARQFAANATTLAALDAFAANGIPGEAVFLRQIVSVLERVEKPVAAAAATAQAGLFDRVQAGLAGLVRVERSDASTATPKPATTRLQVSRTDDLSGVRRDVAKLSQAGQPDIQAWLRSVDEREAALAASRAFTSDALAALAKSGQ